jgi:hypothetical protein
MDSRTADRCNTILKKLRETPIASPFLKPVSDAELANYRSLVSNPMDLSTLRKRLKRGKYKSFNEWEHDLELILKNAVKANGVTHPVAAGARRLMEHYRKLKKQYFASNSVEQLSEDYCGLCLKLDTLLSEHPPIPQLSMFSDNKETPPVRSNQELLAALSQMRSQEQQVQLLFLLRELEVRTDFEGTNDICVNLGELKPETIAKLNDFVCSQESSHTK